MSNKTPRESHGDIIAHFREYGDKAHVAIIGEGDTALVAAKELFEAQSPEFSRFDLNTGEARHINGGVFRCYSLDRPGEFRGPQFTLTWLILSPTLRRALFLGLDHPKMALRLEPRRSVVSVQEGPNGG